MEVLCVVDLATYGTTEASARELTPREVSEVEQMCKAGGVRRIWARSGVRGAVMLVEASCLDTARATLSQLPITVAGMLSIEAYYPLAESSVSEMRVWEDELYRYMAI